MIFFTDLDGTLLNDQKELSEGNRHAIEEALKAGHQVVISTGRPLCSAKLQAKKLNLTQEGCYIISFNGGQIYDIYHQKTLSRSSIPMEQVVMIFEEARKRNLQIQTYSDEYVLTEKVYEELIWYSKTTKVDYRCVPDIAKALEQDPCKIIANCFDHQKLVEYRKEMEPLLKGKMDLFFSDPQLLEHVPTGVSKGSAIRFLCEYLNVPLSETVAAGDAENDIPMIQTAGVGAVMCNGEENTKAYADYITECDNNHDGVAEIIYKFILKK